MANAAGETGFRHIQNEELRTIILKSLQEMALLLEQTPCLSAVSLADQLNEIKKAAFEQMYAIGRETMDLDLSEDVLKAIRALQDAFGQIIVAISPMDNLRLCLKEGWIRELSSSGD